MITESDFLFRVLYQRILFIPLPRARYFRKFVFALVLIGCAFISASASAQSGQPNIVVILADDLGYGDVSYNGCPDYATPNIDSLATNGVWCSSGYVTHSLCSPSRAALMTGRYQQRFGHEHQPQNDPSNPRLGLPLQELLLPQMLKPAGYVCGLIGKWHLGAAPNMGPTQRGFDEFFGFQYEGGNSYFNASLLRNDTPLVESDYLTDAFTREGVSFINHHATEPFFLYLAYNAPHSPYDTPPQAYMDRVANITGPQRQVYAAMITALDDGVGQVLQTLQAQNLLDKTLIFFLSDNGAPQTGFTRNNPLKGYKGSVWEGGIRVPFAVQWTGRLPAGIAYDQPVSALDIVPTAAAAAGVAMPTDRIYDGVNLIPYLAQEQVAPPRTLFWRCFSLGGSGPPGSGTTMYAVRSGSLKVTNPGGGARLFNLSTDIGESNNLAQSQTGDLASLQQLYGQWNADMIAPLWQEASNSFFPMVLAGDWNGFNKDDSTFPWSLTKITAPGPQGTPDAFDWFVNTIHVAATGGDTTPGIHSFVIVGGNYSTQWGGATINIDGTTSVPWFSGNVLGPTNNITFEDGFYYSFRIIDWRLNNPLTIAVLKTSAPPVSVTLAGQTPAVPTSNDSITVNIVTSQPKSLEERIYLRWSTDTYITSHLVEAVGSGVNYFAVIPAQPAGTSVQYCITTSTVDLSQLVTAGSIDFLTLSTTCNTHFVVATGGTSTPTPTPTPSPTATPTPTPTSTVQVTVQTTPAGLTFSVDGASYSSTQTFSWAPGSSHTVGAASPQNGDSGVQYIWRNWSDSRAIAHTVAPTTNKTYTATLSTQYYLTMSRGAGGTVSPTSGWKNSGTTVSITATPGSGYSFTNWTGSGTGSYSGTNNPASVTMNGPITQTATFTHN